MDTEERIKILSEFVEKGRLERMEFAARNRTRRVAVVLEDIYQPHNAAAVMRTCDAFGVQNVCVIENRHKLGISRRVDMGASKWLDIEHFTSKGAKKYVENSRRDKTPDTLGAENTRRALSSLKKRGYILAASTLREGSIPIEELPIDKPIAVMIGTELTGLSEEAHEMSDVSFALPMLGFSQSLNLSVFCAVCLQSILSRIRASDDWRISAGEQNELLAQWLSLSVEGSADIIRKRAVKCLKI